MHCGQARTLARVPQLCRRSAAAGARRRGAASPAAADKAAVDGPQMEIWGIAAHLRGAVVLRKAWGCLSVV